MKLYFVFDVESVGLHGEGYAVAGGVYSENGAAQWEFCFSCHPEDCEGTDSDRKWISENVPAIGISHIGPVQIRFAFWELWRKAKEEGAQAAVECGWPVEARFLEDCIKDNSTRNFDGPYPLHEIASFMTAAGMDPMKMPSWH